MVKRILMMTKETRERYPLIFACTYMLLELCDALGLDGTA